jgi:hypothetical protein
MKEAMSTESLEEAFAAAWAAGRAMSLGETVAYSLEGSLPGW